MPKLDATVGNQFRRQLEVGRHRPRHQEEAGGSVKDCHDSPIDYGRAGSPLPAPDAHARLQSISQTGEGAAHRSHATTFISSFEFPLPHPAIDKVSMRWSNVIKVNFIKHLFSRHPQSERAAPNSYDWPGQSGKEYRYEIYPLGAAFRPLPGIYIYAKQLADGDWSPIYIAQTRDLHQRLEGHVTMQDAVANGTTHIHAHYCTAGQSARCTEERDLIHRWQPVCNDVFQS